MSNKPTSVSIAVDAASRVSGLLLVPDNARACFVLAHGAGAGMTHPFMDSMAEGLAVHGVATLRYQFPYMERGSKRPDPPKLVQATVRAAVAEAARLAPSLPLFAGGKSFGGRMTSQAHAELPLPGICGIIFLGFPLHAAGKPSADRGAHLVDVCVPMLFLQGSRDKLADPSILGPLVVQLGPRASLKVFDDADHSFHVPARSGRKDADVRAEMLKTIAAWVDTVIAAVARP